MKGTWWLHLAWIFVHEKAVFDLVAELAHNLILTTTCQWINSSVYNNGWILDPQLHARGKSEVN